MKKILIITIIFMSITTNTFSEIDRGIEEAFFKILNIAKIPQEEISRLKEEKLSRIDYAIFINSALNKIEKENISMTAEEEKLVQFLIEEFRTEFLILKLQEEIKNNQEEIVKLLSKYNFKINADIKIYVSKLFGDMPVKEEEKKLYLLDEKLGKESEVAFLQQIRLILSVLSTDKELILKFKNFGYWGVGRYTSGSTGIDFSTADPLRFEEAYLHLNAQNYFTRIGRQKLRCGEFGLIFDALYFPVDAIYLEILPYYFVIGSQYGELDSFVTGVKIKKFNLCGFLSRYSKEKRKFFNLENTTGFSLSYNSGKYKMELAFYTAKRNFKGITSSLILNYSPLKELEITVGGISDNFPSNIPPLDIIPQEFRDSKYLRIFTGTKGINAIYRKNINKNLNMETEIVYLVKNEKRILDREIFRIKKSLSGYINSEVSINFHNQKEFRYREISLGLSSSF